MKSQLLQTVRAFVAATIFGSAVLGSALAEDSPSLAETLQWINTTLRENDPNVLLSISANSRDYMRGFSVSVTESGRLDVSHTFVQVGGGLANLESASSFTDWKKFSSDSLFITTMGSDTTYVPTPSRNHPAICARRNSAVVVILPLPLDESLHPRLLKAMRNLLERTKSDLKEPF